MKNRSIVIILVFTIVHSVALGQLVDSLTSVKIGFAEDKIIKDEDFILSVTFISKLNTPILVSPKPIISDLKNGFGDIKVNIARLKNSCYEEYIVDMDPFNVKFHEYTRRINYSDSVLHKIDIRNLHRLEIGMHRVRVYYSFKNENKRYEAVSEWVFFSVNTDKYPRPKSPKLLMEE
jgi:hypothetical protein